MVLSNITHRSPYSYPRFEEGKLRRGHGHLLPVVLQPGSGRSFLSELTGVQELDRGGGIRPNFQPHSTHTHPIPPLRPQRPQPRGVGRRALGIRTLSPSTSSPPHSFTLRLLDTAAQAPVTLRASFADRTLAWVSHWGQKRLISAPFLFYPQRFFEVGQS